MLTDLILIAFTILVTLPANWAATVKLWTLWRARPELGVLRERLIVSMVLTFIVTGVVLAMVNAQLDGALFGESAGRILARVLIGLLCVPALYWLWLYRRS